jgi:hypothetical protein
MPVAGAVHSIKSSHFFCGSDLAFSTVARLASDKIKSTTASLAEFAFDCRVKRHNNRSDSFG